MVWTDSGVQTNYMCVYIELASRPVALESY